VLKKREAEMERNRNKDEPLKGKVFLRRNFKYGLIIF
jgi:hypothetical protein